MSRPPGPHRPADPVRTLLHRHRELCERAVDPLEIAAALEAHGITDRTAARYRHRDVFSLAEELYARTPRADEASIAPAPTAPATAAPSPTTSAPEPRRRGAGRVRVALRPLLPGGLCAATLSAPALLGGAPPAVRTALLAAGFLAVTVSAWLCLRLFPGPWGARSPRAAVLGGCWLVGHALVGDRLPAEALGDGAVAVAPLAERWVPLGLAVAVAPAVWCAHWFAAGARRRLRAGRSLEEFAARTRPLFAVVVAVFAATLLAVLTAAHVAVDGGRGGGWSGGWSGGWDGGAVGDAIGAPVVAATAFGTLLFVAVLLTSHGFPTAATGGIAAACLLEAAALAAAAVARRPGLEPLGRPVEAAVAAWGPAVVPAVACAAAALALSAVAAGALTGASAHHRDGP
ncbi:hypothetical protein [Streptomyces macrosporus]|uniref:Integral membrane protein n=1 Tax=Streptomyces macrosporus TaxID=44032 RepID=A0ABN3KL81_9ACTN